MVRRCRTAKNNWRKFANPRRFYTSLGTLTAGVERAADAVYEDLKPHLKKEYPIIVMGHLLGAAEAIIVGMFLQREGYSLDKIVASGIPKVTDEAG